MKNFNFNEKQDIEDMIASGYVDELDYSVTIGKLALYNYCVLNLKREDNYDAIKEYMTANAMDFFEAEYQKTIYKEILLAKNHILRNIESVDITESELERIIQLNDIRKEKIAFVLLAVAKYYNTIKNCNNNYVNLSNRDICKLARITMRISERKTFMSFIYNENLVERHNNPNSNSKKILFISDKDNDNIILSLKQIDFQELAYQYLNWRDGGGFDKCVFCERLIKHRPNIKYCEECQRKAEKIKYAKYNDKRRS